jgi:hypothetical protein
MLELPNHLYKRFLLCNKSYFFGIFLRSCQHGQKMGDLTRSFLYLRENRSLCDFINGELTGREYFLSFRCKTHLLEVHAQYE